MSRIRTAFLGTPEIAKKCLEALIKDEHFEVVGVATQPDRPSGRNMKLTPSPVKSLAESLGIPVLSPESINTKESLEQVSLWKAEVAIVVAFGQIVSQKFLDLFPSKVVNLHASLLPKWRGAAPVQRSLMAGDLETGVSLQIMVKKLDAGPLLGVRKIPISPNLNSIELFDEVITQGADLLAVDLMDYLRGNLSAEPQNESDATYAHKITKEEAQVDWTLNALTVHNQIRGLAAGPQAFTSRKGKLFKIHRSEVAPKGVLSLKPGELGDLGGELYVGCADDAIKLLEVQPESKPKMPSREYLKGHPVLKGDHFDL